MCLEFEAIMLAAQRLQLGKFLIEYITCVASIVYSHHMYMSIAKGVGAKQDRFEEKFPHWSCHDTKWSASNQLRQYTQSNIAKTNFRGPAKSVLVIRSSSYQDIVIHVQYYSKPNRARN